MNTSTMERMRIIRAHLEATSRGKSPTPEQVAVWMRELQSIPDERLDEAIRSAREHHAEQVDRGKRWGKLTPDDVLVLTKAQAPETEGPPTNEDCPYRCTEGRVSLRDPEGYDVCVRCSCFAGDYWKKQHRLGEGRDVEDCLAYGYTEIRPRWKIPASHKEWIIARTGEVGWKQANIEYAAHMEERDTAQK